MRQLTSVPGGKAFDDALQRAHDSLEVRGRERTAEVQSLFTRGVSAQEEERRRVARDSHDHVEQQMTALRMNIASLGVDVGDGPARNKMKRTDRLAEELDTVIDFLTWELRPAAHDGEGFTPGLQQGVAAGSSRLTNMR